MLAVNPEVQAVADAMGDNAWGASASSAGAGRRRAAPCQQAHSRGAATDRGRLACSLQTPACANLTQPSRLRPFASSGQQDDGGRVQQPAVP